MANQLMSELIDSLASKAGIDTNDESYKTWIQDKRLSEISVPENVASHLSTSVGSLTLESAKNHPDLAKHYKVKYLTTVDNHLKNYFKGNGLEELYSEVEAEPDTIKRFDKALHKVYEYAESKASKKAPANNDEKYVSLTKQYNDLQAQYNNEKTSWSQKEVEWQSNLEKKEIDWQIDNMLASYSYSDAIPVEDVKFLVKEKIKNLPYTFKKADKSIGVFQKENPDLVAFSEGNKPLSIKDILDKEVSPYTRKTTQTQNSPRVLPKPNEANGKNLPPFASKLANDVEKFNKIKSRHL